VSSTDARIKAEATLFSKEIASIDRQRSDAFARRAERLNRLLHDELGLMRGRAYEDGAEKRKEARWLRDKSYDKTYRDRGPDEGRPRIRRRITALLELCGKDEQLFLDAYTRQLNFWFPIPYKSYEWAPKLIQNGRHSTIVHKWRRRRFARHEDSGPDNDGDG
jgi:hypothetical protein